MGASRKPVALTRRAIVGATLSIALSIAVGIAFWRIAPQPLFSEPQSWVLLARDGTLLGARIADDGQWRFPPMTQVPEKYRAALLAYEDKRFYYHPGIDPLAVARAVRLNLRRDRVVSGASTLTMQVARLVRAPRSDGEGGDRRSSRGLGAKLLDVALALRLETQFSKDEILALYASHAPFGGNVVGLEAAAWRYFGRDPTALSWAEAATLAVLPNQPALVTLGRNRARLQNKRDGLLRRLHAAGQLGDLDLQLALAEPLAGTPLALPNDAPHLLETLRQRYPDQHRFASTLDATLQRNAVQIVQEQSRELARQSIHNAAALIVDNQSFEVLAYVGNSGSMSLDHGFAVDIVQRPRSTGSILKPLLYAAMLDSGQLLPHMLVPDVPMQYADYAPENFDRSYRGAVPADVALAQSLNVPAVRLLRDYGVDRFYDLLKGMGMSTLNNPPDHYGLTLILGGAEGTLWDITAMHANLVALARQQLPDVANSNHPMQVLLQEPAAAANRASTRGNASAHNSASALSPAAAWLTLNALLEVPRPAEEANWRSFASSRKIAWKTGTSWGQRDAWAVGSTGRYTVSVWAGNASGDGRPGLTGSVAAAPIMFELQNRLPMQPWIAQPTLTMKRVEVCRNDGYLANDYCAHESQWIPANSHFDRQSPYNMLVHLDASGRSRVDSDCERVSAMRHVGWFVLPPTQEFYYRRQNAAYRELPPVRAGCSSAFAGRSGRGVMDFLYPGSSSGANASSGPNADTQVYIPLDLDGRRGRVVFEAVHRDANAELFWHIDGHFVGSTHTFHQQALDLEPGPHVVTIVDAQGNRLERRFEVLAGSGNSREARGDAT